MTGRAPVSVWSAYAPGRVARTQTAQTGSSGSVSGGPGGEPRAPALSLIRLTREGEHAIRRIHRREAGVLARTDAALSEAELRRAADTLRAIRTAIER